MAMGISVFRPVGSVVPTVRWGRLTASEVFEAGDMVGIVNAGTLTEPTDDAAQYTLAQMDTVGNICGVAATGVQSSGVTLNDFNTGIAITTGAQIAFWPADQGTLFITRHLTTAGGTTAVAPALTDIGEIYQISYNTTANTTALPDQLGWGVEQTAGVPGTDVCAIVVDVLDANYVPIKASGGPAGVYVVFEIKTK